MLETSHLRRRRVENRGQNVVHRIPYGKNGRQKGFTVRNWLLQPSGWEKSAKPGGKSGRFCFGLALLGCLCKIPVFLKKKGQNFFDN